MKYKHPTLGREAKQISDAYFKIDEAFCRLDKVKFLESEIKGMGFEPVEETPEWIDKAREDYLDNGDYHNEGYFKEAILKHMPKVIIEEFDNLCKETHCHEHYWVIKRLLEKKGLLQE